MALHTITDQPGIDALVAELRRTSRDEPVVVVSTHRGHDEPFVDAAKLANDLSGMASVYLLREPMWLPFAATLGRKALNTHPGGVRIYPPGPSWDTSEARLNIQCHSGRGGARVRALVAEQVQRLNYGSKKATTSTSSPSWSPMSVTVDGVVDETQIMVRTEDRRSSLTMKAVDLFPGVAPDRLVKRGQPLEGRGMLAGLLGSFVPSAIDLRPRERAKETFPNGTFALARVDSCDAHRAILHLHPEFPVIIDGDEGDDLTVLLRAGDVVVVEVVWEGDYCLLGFCEPTSDAVSMAILPGGPPWLVLDEPRVDADDAADRIDEVDSTGAADLEDLLTTIAILREENETMRSKLRRAEDDARAARTSLRSQAAAGRPIVAADPEEQFRFEVMLSYLVTTSADERRRADNPLPSDYVVGPDFLSTVHTLTRAGGIKREKIVDVSAEVVSELARENSSRNVRPWNDGANGPQIIRGDGATCWRVNLQTNSASARRLKYWKLPDGTIELDSVGVHDDGI